MSIKTMAFICFLAFLVVTVLIMVLFRHRFAFKSMFNVWPKEATQTIVDREIEELQEELAQREKGLEHFPTEEYRDWAGVAENNLNRARKVALRYHF